MKLVTDAAPIRNNYSIIINKLHIDILKKLQDPTQRQILFTLLNEGLPGTTHI